ncbi:MAG TPA: hypothetical protein VNO31_18825, partial [Umezawaea sp.]|nr:hypothetical protein [Umezawaea sp.]
MRRKLGKQAPQNIPPEFLVTAKRACYNRSDRQSGRVPHRLSTVDGTGADPSFVRSRPAVSERFAGLQQRLQA